MARTDLKYATGYFTGGINHDPVTADFSSQCAEARNVWSPGGNVERRPGSEFMFHTGMFTRSTFDTLTASSRTFKSVGGVDTDESAPGVLDVSDLAVDGMVYVGWATLPTTVHNNVICGLLVQLGTANSNASYFKMEYWNGANWVLLPSLRQGNSRSFDSKIFQTATTEYLSFSIPSDWATSTQAFGSALYWLRVVVKETALDASVAFNGTWRFVVPDDSTGGITEARPMFRSVWSGKVANQYIYGTLWANYVSSGGVYKRSGVVAGFKGLGDTVAGNTHSFALPAPTDLNVSEPVTTASNPYNNLTYITLPGGVYQIGTTNFCDPAVAGSTIPTLSKASVEEDPTIVGINVTPTAPYDKSLVAQLGDFPICKYISYFQNRLWCSGIEGQDQIVRWGAAAPYHRVFPSLNYEDVIENSSQPISGMAPLNANMMVYKEDSIHQMIYTGLNGFQEATFVPQTVARGIGCVSNASIAEINGSHVFLSNAGIARFDGNRASYITQAKIRGSFSDRLGDIWPDLDPGRYKFAVGVHWKAKHCYLLAASYKGSATNNLVIVWDYVQDAVWLWDGIDVAGWFFDDESQTSLCYSDSYGRLFKLSGGNDFGTAISSYVTTPRLGLDDAYSENLRMAELSGTSNNGATTVSFIANDQVNKSGTLTWLDPLENVYGTAKYGTATYAAKKIRNKRLSTWQVGRDHQVKLANNTKNSKFEIEALRLGYTYVGKR